MSNYVPVGTGLFCPTVPELATAALARSCALSSHPITDYGVIEYRCIVYLQCTKENKINISFIIWDKHAYVNKPSEQLVHSLDCTPLVSEI